MKKSMIASCLMMLYSFSPVIYANETAPVAAQTRQVKTTTATELEFTNLYELCMRQYALFYNQLLGGLNTIDGHINQWKQDRMHPWRSTLTQSPRYWFSPLSYTDRVTRNIFRLKQQHRKLASCLGQVNDLINEVKSITDVKELKHHISFHYDVVLRAMGATVPVQAPTTYTHMIRHMHTTIELLQSYHKKLSYELSDIQSGGHIERNWLKYLIGTTALVGAGLYGTQHAEELTTLGTEYTTAARDGVTNFWETHIKVAFTNAWNAIFKPHASLESRTLKIKSVAQCIESYFKEFHTEFSPEQINQIVENYKTSLIYPIQLVEDYNKTRENPLKSSLYIPWIYPEGSPKKTENIAICLLGHKEIELEDMQQQLDTLTKLALISPAIFIAKAAWNGAGKITNLFKRTQLHTPIKKYLLKMERKLNAQTNKSQTPDYHDQGLMIYWGHELRKFMKLIPKAMREEFVKDIKEIERADFTAQQKISTIKRMYRTYDFLLPNVD